MPGQDGLDLGELAVLPQRMQDVGDFTAEPKPAPSTLIESDSPVWVPVSVTPVPASSGTRVVGTPSAALWQMLDEAYARLGLDVLGDGAFAAMVLARIVEPTSKADTVRVLGELGAPCPSVRTLFRSLKRCQERDYRGQVAKACAAFSSGAGGLSSLIMYDVTTLHFEVDEDDLRKVGMSKEHRVDPQVQVGLLVDSSGFPLEVHLFEGNKAETRTIVPVLEAFQERHGVTDLVVVADAGMLSAANLNAIEDAGFSFIVGSRITKAPYDLAEHFTRHGDYFVDGQILESTRTTPTTTCGRSRKASGWPSQIAVLDRCFITGRKRSKLT